MEGTKLFTVVRIDNDSGDMIFKGMRVGTSAEAVLKEYGDRASLTAIPIDRVGDYVVTVSESS